MSLITLDYSLFNRTDQGCDLVDSALVLYQRMREQQLISMTAAMPLPYQALSPEVREWLLAHHCRHQCQMRFVQALSGSDRELSGFDLIFEIDIKDDDLALLFKLTWGGK